MNTVNPLSTLIIDYWYKAMLVISVILLICSLTIDIHIIGNLALMLISTGAMFISIGEWINHPYQEHIGPNFIASSYNRQPCRLGSLFDILGFIVVCLGIWQAIKFIS